MPFDSTSTASVNPLAKLGITPVSSWVVEAHKAKVLQSYLTTPHKMRPHDPGYAAWTIECGYAGWRTLTFGYRPLVYVFTRDMLDLPEPPAALARIARIARRRHPRAYFAVQYFNDDPILSIHLPEGPQCLGIWDESGIVEIADYTAPLSWWSRCWASFYGSSPS